MNKFIKQYVGLKLKEYRKLHGINQDTLADYLGVTRNSVCNMESGRHGLDVDKIYLLCCLFAIEANSFFPDIKHVTITHEDVQVVKTKRKIVINKNQ